MASPILELKTPKRSKSPLDCKIISPKKEASSHPEITDTSGNYKSEQLALEESWRITPPPWLNKSVISEIVTFKSQCEKMNKLVLEHEKTITYLLNENIRMNKEIEALKLRTTSKDETDDIWESNKIEIARMEKMFNLPPPSGEPIKQQIRTMRGYLKEYSEEGVDIVDLIHEMRDHE